MVKLQPLPGSELSAYVVELLAKQEITTIRDFLTADTHELSKKSNLSVECIQQLQSKLCQIHSAKRLNTLQCYQNIRSRFKIYGFGIDSLDSLLGAETFNSNSIFEIFGNAAIGKTIFCHTVTANVVRAQEIEALYIDTKLDFSGTCLYKIMRAKNIEKSECGNIMQRVKVKRTLTLQGVCETLHHLEELLQADDALVAAIKVVIIDSLPAVWFTLNGDEERLERKYLICKISNLLHKLSKDHFIAILLINLAVQDGDDAYVENAAVSELGAEIRQASPVSSQTDLPLKPALGRYWAAVPHTRLCMRMADDADDFADERLIEITRNVYGPSGGCCHVRITDAGVIS